MSGLEIEEQGPGKNKHVRGHASDELTEEELQRPAVLEYSDELLGSRRYELRQCLLGHGHSHHPDDDGTQFVRVKQLLEVLLRADPEAVIVVGRLAENTDETNPDAVVDVYEGTLAMSEPPFESDAELGDDSPDVEVKCVYLDLADSSDAFNEIDE